MQIYQNDTETLWCTQIDWKKETDSSWAAVRQVFSHISLFSVSVSGEEGNTGRRVPCVFLPFHTPLCPWAEERERERRKKREWRDTWGRCSGQTGTLRETGGPMVNDVIGRGQAGVGAFLRSLRREVQTAGSWICLCWAHERSKILKCACYLMRLVPAILISCPQRCSVVQQGLAAGSVAPYQYSVVQRSQATAVLVVWGCSEWQEKLQKQKECSKKKNKTPLEWCIV